MIRTIGILTFFLFWADVAWTQQITLDQSITASKEHYPLAKAKNEVASATEAKLSSLQAQYYPQFDLTGQMTWQNDVPHTVAQNINFQMPTASKDQYKSYVDVKQIIYDGGAISASKEAEKMKGEADRRNIEVELRQAENGVIQAYFPHFVHRQATGTSRAEPHRLAVTPCRSPLEGEKRDDAAKLGRPV
jgi:hypothetical protein